MSNFDIQSAQQVSVSLGGDLSASRRSAWLCIGRNTKSVSLDITTPATGAPRGAYTLEVANLDSATSGEIHPATQTAAALASNPATPSASTIRLGGPRGDSESNGVK